MQEKEKSDLEKLITVIPSSTIPLEHEHTEPVKPLINADKVAEDFWASKSNQFFTDYRYGKSLAYFGKNDSNIISLFSRISYALRTIINNELLKRGESSEGLKYHFLILDSCMQIISKEIAKKDLKDFDITSIVASLHGFLTNYIHDKKV